MHLTAQVTELHAFVCMYVSIFEYETLLDVSKVFGETYSWLYPTHATSPLCQVWLWKFMQSSLLQRHLSADILQRSQSVWQLSWRSISSRLHHISLQVTTTERVSWFAFPVSILPLSPSFETRAIFLIPKRMKMLALGVCWTLYILIALDLSPSFSLSDDKQSCY